MPGGNRAGQGIGEHFGYLFTALWTVSVAAALWGRYRLIAATGLVQALGIAGGMGADEGDARGVFREGQQMPVVLE